MTEEEPLTGEIRTEVDAIQDRLREILVTIPEIDLSVRALVGKIDRLAVAADDTSEYLRQHGHLAQAVKLERVIDEVQNGATSE